MVYLKNTLKKKKLIKQVESATKRALKLIQIVKTLLKSNKGAFSKVSLGGTKCSGRGSRAQCVQTNAK